MRNRKNKIALVTGASRKIGIGAAIERELARDGTDVFITCFRPYDHETGLACQPEEPQILLADLQNMGCNAAGLEIDLSKSNAPQHLFDHVEATFGPVSILINTATYSMRDGIENLNADQLDKHYAVNIRAMALLCARFVKRYKKNFSGSNNGRIINLSSGQSVGPMPGRVGLCGHKRCCRSIYSESERRGGGIRNYSECR